MNTIFFDRNVPDDVRREDIYKGQIYTYNPSIATAAFIKFSQELIEDAFKGMDPLTAQYNMPVEEYVEVLKKLKPFFIHHPESKKHIQNILIEKDCDPELTFFDVPRMRSATSDGYLTSGIAYAFHPHRDTWYSAPMCQINWWLPIYEIESGNVMAFHLEYFSKGIQNNSNEYNYQEWTATSRKEAAKHVKKDTRKQPHAQSPVKENPQLRVVMPAGGLLCFSASHLHSSVENKTGKTRFSIDFRTVHLGDLEELKGAVNVDSGCSGTTMVDY